VVAALLKKEGLYRELMRALQDARKKAGLEVGQKVSLKYWTEDESLKSVITERESEIKESANFSEIKFEQNDGEEALKGKIKIEF